MMKKLALISLVLAGLAGATVGCASKEVASNPETALSQAPVANTTASAGAQGNVAVQADPTLQSDQSQAAPADSSETAPATAQ